GDLPAEGSTLDAMPVARVRREVDDLTVERAHDVVELLRWDGVGAGLRHVGHAAAAEADLEVRSEDLEAVAVRPDEQMREEGDGRLRLDDAQAERELALELLLADGELHVAPRWLGFLPL